MARAIARGLGEPVLATDGGSGRAEALAAETGGRAMASNVQLAREVDVVVLCHKPAQLHQVAAEIDGTAACVISTLARTSYQQLQQAYTRSHVFRVMPNLPIEVGRGVTVFASPPAGADLEWRKYVVDLFGRVGRVVELPETQIDAAGAINGVGPAYVALVAEAWVDAAVRRGMPAPQAAALVSETLLGSAELLRQRRNDTLALRREVASPGGTTARGVAALEAGGVRSALSDAMDAVLDWERR